jgi:hypothetical protein
LDDAVLQVREWHYLAHALVLLNFEMPGLEKSSSIAGITKNKLNLLGSAHKINLIVDLNGKWVDSKPVQPLARLRHHG